MIQSRISVPLGLASCQSAERFKAAVIAAGSRSAAEEECDGANEMPATRMAQRRWMERITVVWMVVVVFISTPRRW